MFSEMHERRGDAAVVWHEFAAAADCALDDEDSWHAANPGLGTIKSLSYMRDMSRRALASPADQRSFRALDLNSPVDPGKEPICTVSDYQACVVSELPERSGVVYIGFDLGGSASMTALSAFLANVGPLRVLGGVSGYSGPGGAGRFRWGRQSLPGDEGPGRGQNLPGPGNSGKGLS